MDDSALPQAVEVAVLVSGDHLVTLAQGEGNGGSLARLESLALVALLGLERHLLNVMLHRTYSDGDLVALELIDGDILFLGLVPMA